MKFKKEELFTIPNILTYIRLISIPFFMWMMIAYAIDETATKYIWAGFGIFLFAEITDICDGYIARHFNQISDIGKVLDPIADKVLQCVSMLMLAICGNLHWAFVVIIIVKEVYMGVTSKYWMRASKRQVEQKSNKVGKAGATIYFVGILLAFFNKIDTSKIVFYIDLAILIIGSILAVVAAVQYTVIYTKKLKEVRASGILDTLDRYGNPLPIVEPIEQSDSDKDAQIDVNADDGRSGQSVEQTENYEV